MIDLNLIREKPDYVKQQMVKLNAQAPIDRIVELDIRRRELLQEVEALRQERNVVSKEIGRMKDATERQIKIAAMREVANRIGELDEDLRRVETDLEDAMLWVPNLPHASVPIGPDESQNVVIRQVGEPGQFPFEPLPHWDLGPMLGILDFERGVKLSGSRFYVLRGAGARLQRALIDWMLDVHTTQHGYTEIYPPAMVKSEAFLVAAQLPKFADNIYHDAEEDFLWIGTAEIPLTNLHRDEILDGDELPLKYVAHTPCFRREKMSAGRDVRGIKRGHQFEKVEMYRFTRPEDSYEALEELVRDAAAICEGLEIPYRVIEMCTGDLGFSAAKKYDLELWAPGVQEWLEVSSCSNTEDFQARRGNIRFRREPGARPEYVHTLNGSGLALPRVMIAVIENYQQKDGSIRVPDVLQPYLGGMQQIG